MNQDSLGGPTSLSRRRMLHTLSLGGVGVALAGQFPAYAMQAARTADAPPFVPLNRFPRMVQEFFVARENADASAAAEKAGGTEHEGRRRSLRPDRPGKNSRILRTLSRKDAAQRARDEGRRTGRLQDRERPLRKPPGVPGVGQSLHSEGTDVSRSRAWSPRAGTRPTARRSRRIKRSARGWRARAMWC